jgi:hypothetical protein
VDAFSYLSVLLSIILGLGLTQILDGPAHPICKAALTNNRPSSHAPLFSRRER